jgi:hypothetical protein
MKMLLGLLFLLSFATGCQSSSKSFYGYPTGMSPDEMAKVPLQVVYGVWPKKDGDKKKRLWLKVTNVGNKPVALCGFSDPHLIGSDGLLIYFRFGSIVAGKLTENAVYPVGLARLNPVVLHPNEYYYYGHQFAAEMKVAFVEFETQKPVGLRYGLWYGRIMATEDKPLTSRVDTVTDEIVNAND